MSTIAVMGTPFTMDPRFYTSGPPENRFYRCSHTHSLFVPHRDFFDSQYLDPSDIFEAWELVIDGVQKKDSGVYHCRLTGKQPQSLLYHLTIKSMLLIYHWPLSIYRFTYIFTAILSVHRPFIGSYFGN